jgi:8-oxo-dGTP pyrophosphatase MutT (NUDIX family)
VPSDRAAAGQELVALVDPAGRVTGVAPRWQVRRDNLLHGATAVLVRDPGGRIYVSRRSPDKDWAPSFHDASAGGVLQAGEDPTEAALRELEEELGITGVALRPLLVEHYEYETVRCVLHCYETVYDGPVTHPDGEVVWGGWMSLADLGRRLADPGWAFVPDTAAVLARLGERRVGDYATLGLATPGPTTPGPTTPGPTTPGRPHQPREAP